MIQVRDQPDSTYRNETLLTLSHATECLSAGTISRVTVSLATRRFVSFDDFFSDAES